MSTQELIDELEEESAAMCLNLTAPPEAATWTLERIRGYFESPESLPASESTAAVPGYLDEEMRIAEEAAAVPVAVNISKGSALASVARIAVGRTSVAFWVARIFSITLTTNFLAVDCCGPDKVGR